MAKRYYPNPVHDDDTSNEDALAVLGSIFDEDEAWRRVESLLETFEVCLERREMPQSDESWARDATLYSGIGGLGFAYLRAAIFCYPGDYKKYASLALRAAEIALDLAPSSRFVSLMTGTVGNEAVKCIATYALTGELDVSRLLAEASRAQTHEEDELLFGKAGYICCLLWTQTTLERFGYAGTAGLDDALATTSRALIEACRQRRTQGWQMGTTCFGERYLGAAHGLAGVMAVLHVVGCKGLLDARDADRLEACTAQLVHLFLSAETRNLPVTLDKESDDLVHWCHGAAGIPELVRNAACHARVRAPDADLDVLQAAARRAADLIWERGLLLKGAGLCHGVAGNAYAFLSVASWLDDADRLRRRAVAFAAMIDNPALKAAQAATRDPQRKVSNLPDSPYSLMEGTAGVACFLLDVAAPPHKLVGFPGYGDFLPPPFLARIQSASAPAHSSSSSDICPTS